MGGDGDKVWFHRSIARTVQAPGSGDGDETEEEKAFLVPSAAAFPHGMFVAAAGQSLAMAKKEEFSKSPSNSPASSGDTGGGSSAVPWP
ncbi:Protein DWARF AND LOW-TILLERING [Zea mays]|uniref:Protein DWARF AND LOW-TILLERING n=1 Tax=Zea mays TaxID=4577 RepID=A0A317YAR3_MAIZE|nr:Protein DWARF AND LOW-TILLERING [Zea mays]